MGAILAVAALAAVAVAHPLSAAAADTLEPDTGALVRFAHGVPTMASQPISVSVDGEAWGVGGIPFATAGPFQRVSGGEHQLTARTTSVSVASAVVSLQAGCYHTVLLAQPDGLRRTPRFVDLMECERRRLPSGRASIRLLNATADNGPVRLASGGLVANPFSASSRVDVPAGLGDYVLRSPTTGEILAREPFKLDANTSYSLFYAGGGETPLRLSLLWDGNQPAEPTEPGMPTNTGSARGRPSVPLAIAGAAVFVLAVVLIRRRTRWLTVLLALGLLTAGCTSPSRPVPVAAPSPTPTTIDQPATSLSPPNPPRRASGLPVRVEIPSIAVSAPVIQIPARQAGDLHHLLDGTQVAWLTGTTAPGEPGVTAFAGHIVKDGSPGVFGGLAQLRRGDTITVMTHNGGASTFTVRARFRWPKREVPADLYAPTPESTLLLITCIGDVDPESGLFADNLIVVATS